ncbi:hypothetical protein K438DRAFT_1763506 [Mycena galopus ATCC 62051]|nr:hypothetical protein K438DRAFT_1763506 [Mycena galopus ATCC 62051]
MDHRILKNRTRFQPIYHARAAPSHSDRAPPALRRFQSASQHSHQTLDKNLVSLYKVKEGHKTHQKRRKPARPQSQSRFSQDHSFDSGCGLNLSKLEDWWLVRGREIYVETLMQTESLRLCLSNQPFFSANDGINIILGRKKQLEFIRVIWILPSLKGEDLVVRAIQTRPSAKCVIAFVKQARHIAEYAKFAVKFIGGNDNILYPAYLDQWQPKGGKEEATCQWAFLEEKNPEFRFTPAKSSSA